MSLNVPFRIYAQYRTKPKARAWYDITRTIGDELCTGLQQIRETYDIDTQEGAQLDVIGRIVGLRRPNAPTQYDPGVSWGGSTAQFGGSQFTGEYLPVNGLIDDATYRILLRAKIAINNGDATIEGILDNLFILIGDKNLQVVDPEDMSFSINIPSNVDPLIIYAIETYNLIEKPQGVKFNGFVSNKEVTQYGGGKDYGESSAQYGFNV